MKEEYRTKYNEILYSENGNRATGDRRLYIGKDGHKWAHSLELIGAALRAKAWVEDNNYPNGLGRFYLHAFISGCILCDKLSIKTLMKKFKINE